MNNANLNRALMSGPRFFCTRCKNINAVCHIMIVANAMTLVTIELMRQINLSISVGNAKFHAATWNAPRTETSKAKTARVDQSGKLTVSWVGYKFLILPRPSRILPSLAMMLAM